MHLHVTETVLGDPGRELAGRWSLPYPSDRPTYAVVSEAIAAAVSSAMTRWGELAAAHVELALLNETDRGKHHTLEGALAGWAAPDSGGAWWCVRACGCADGTLAQVFGGGPVE